ncbi:GntR family transcriptional regulator [Amycolatopsis sp. MtRt-6]|uniref:GntR family transcriptional regulator n=1 Tax=Amycolatopsis sp. MtRt-6 TaxID=2792782 RepID=UPI001A8FA51E|nr:GntR family transcriptional regulator [Amycolatopsis sp. MtRt-6]
MSSSEPEPSGRDPRLSLTERTHALIKEDILTARRLPESMLVEHELAREYGVSKTPIREALRLLAHDGWVLVLPRKGYLVRPLRFEDVREIFALRQMIEPPLVVEAAKRSSPEQLDALERHIDDQAAAASTEAALNAATAFHLDIARLSGNRRAERIMLGVTDEVRRMHYLAPNLRSRLTEDAEIRDHRDLVSAMRRLDIERAYEIMDRHSQESLRQKLEGLTTI